VNLRVIHPGDDGLIRFPNAWDGRQGTMFICCGEPFAKEWAYAARCAALERGRRTQARRRAARKGTETRRLRASIPALQGDGGGVQGA